MKKKISKKVHAFRALFLTNFLFAFSIALPAYVSSNFLKEFVSAKFIGIIYTLGSLLTIIAFANIPKVLRKLTNYKTAIALVVIQIILLLTLAIANNIFIIIASFILYWTTTSLLVFNLDIFLENFSADDSTGDTRGKFFTAGNTAWIIAPASAGYLLISGGFWRIFLAAAIFTMLIAYMLVKNFRYFKDPEYTDIQLISTFKKIITRKNILKIFASNFLLYFFYSWMIIYMPIYLHSNLGFSMQELGIMFTIMLTPFILIEFPAGKLADAKLGEKELLIIGFIIMAISTISLSFITSSSFWLWTSVLFITRIGASLVEIMTETYFFKKIDSTNIHLLSAYRSNRSFASVVAPLVASLFLIFFGFKYLFILLGVIMLLGISFSLTLEDTK